MPQLGLRITDEQQQRIQASANQAGQTITEYVLSWLPDTYDRSTPPDPDKQPTQRRGAGGH